MHLARVRNSRYRRKDDCLGPFPRPDLHYTQVQPYFKTNGLLDKLPSEILLTIFDFITDIHTRYHFARLCPRAAILTVELMRDVSVHGCLLKDVSEYDFGNAEPGSFSRLLGGSRFPGKNSALFTGLFVAAPSETDDGLEDEPEVLIAIGKYTQRYDGPQPLSYGKVGFPWNMESKKRSFRLSFVKFEEESYLMPVTPQSEDGLEEESDY